MDKSYKINLIKQELDKRDEIVLAILYGSYGREVDLVDLNKINGTILTQILTKGIVLKKTDIGVYANLIIKMLDYEEDMAPNVRYIIDKRLEGFINEK